MTKMKNRSSFIAFIYTAAAVALAVIIAAGSFAWHRKKSKNRKKNK